ncbi:MAG: cell wall metabolism sensor histidine kinase WalK [Ruminococcaceae bacterium]|nr:cell wall metabolism sensor histidine kinase WalK [Oscillospiraceae bacterium]
MFKSIQWKIIAIFLLLTVSVMIVVGTFLIQNISAYYYSDFNNSLDTQVFTEDVVEDFEAVADSSDPLNGCLELLKVYSVRMGIDSFRNYYILDSSLNILGGSSSETGTKESSSNIILALDGKRGNRVDKNSEIMDYALPLNDGEYIIYVTDSMQEVDEIITNMFVNIFWALLFGLLISLILGYFLSRTIISPISTLQHRSESMAEGDFTHKIEVRSRDEIGRLTIAFNEMAAKINTSLEEIQAEKNKVEAILLNMTDAVLAYDNTGTLIHINPAGENLLGEHKEKSFDEFFDLVEANISLYRILYIDSNESIERDIEYKGKSLKAYFAPFNTERSLTAGVVVVFQDITRRQMLDNARREFVANVSHELRTPLTTIKTYAETISDMGEENVDSSVLHFVGVIENEADRMTRLVKDLLTLSQLDSSKIIERRKKFDLAQLISSVIEKLGITAKQSGHRIKSDIRMSSSVCFGEPDAIEQVLTNIISNAIKYTPGGGKIEVKCYGDFSKAYITVQDNGIGIPESDLPRIFERFYRVDKARSRQSGGTGLGLAIAKEIILRHEGTIEIESPQQKGTIVKIMLPLYKKDEME